MRKEINYISCPTEWADFLDRMAEFCRKNYLESDHSKKDETEWIEFCEIASHFEPLLLLAILDAKIRKGEGYFGNS